MHEPNNKIMLHHFLSNAAASWPDAVAVEDSWGRLTFSDLCGSACDLAEYFGEAGLEPGDRIALIMPKSSRAMISIYASLIAGTVFIPIDPYWPDARIVAVLEDLNPKLVISDSQVSLEKFGTLTSEKLDIFISVLESADGARSRLSTRSESETESSIDHGAENPAYILMTSGSTGRPKGVVVSHEAATAFPQWTTSEFGLAVDDRIACPAPLSFDLSTFDLFATVMSGATMVVIPKELYFKPKLLSGFIRDEKITHWYSVPSILTILIKDGDFTQIDYPDLRYVLFAGEVFPSQYLSMLRRHLRKAELWNLYGPTETNVVMHYKLPEELGKDDSITIGSPCPYAKVRLDSPESDPEDGELLVAGQSLMTGYWNEQILTQSAEEAGPSHSRLEKGYYRTGDFCRIRYDGKYMFLGRIDRQVKRRGYRIELDEIELAINGLPGVEESAVISTAAEAEVKIVACIKMSNSRNESVVDMRIRLARVLPTYMIPDRFRFVDELPRNERGKTHYQLLEKIVSGE